MKTFNTQAAQGDLLISRILKIPETAVLQRAEKGCYIVAHSETGHHHVIAEQPHVRLYSTTDPLVSYLEVVEAADAMEVLLEHLRTFHTHETIRIPPGVFEIRRQREYTPQGWRQVAD